MPWLPSVGLLTSVVMMGAGLLLVLDAGIHMARKLREEDHR